VNKVVISRIWYQNFRNLTESVLVLGTDCPTVIVGGNNQGKTSVLEALSVLLTGKSPLGALLDETISFLEENVSIVGDALVGDTFKRYSVRIKRQEGLFGFCDKESIKSYRKVIREVPSVYISSDILYAFKESPSARRDNLDRFCERYFDDYSGLLRQYGRVVAQKNKLLKQNFSEKDVEIWSEKLVELAGEIIVIRQEGLEKIRVFSNQLGAEMGYEFVENLSIKYYPSGVENYSEKESYKQQLRDKIKTSFLKESVLGYSLYGIHRDDYVLFLSSQNLFSYFSRGINKMVAILIELAQQLLIVEKSNRYPIILMDEPFSELEFNYKKRLISLINQYFQLVYTSVIEEDQQLFDDKIVYRMSGGVLYCG